MPQRALGLLTGLCGLALVMALIVVGLDLRRAARTGPQWKRRLLAAGLVVVGMLGLYACDGGEPGDGGSATSTVTAGGPADSDLARTPEWQRLTATWSEAEQIASGKRGDYPFDEAGKKRMLERLAEVGTDIGALEAEGVLTAAEAGLLTKELATLTEGVQAKRPTAMIVASCYEVMGVQPARESMERLAVRLPLLAQLAAAETLRSEVLKKALGTVEQDLVTLREPGALGQLPEEKRAEAEQLRDAAAGHVRRIRARLAGETTQLQDAAEWKTILDAWHTAAPLAVSGVSTTAQREATDKKLAAAREAITKLAAAGLLQPGEARLLGMEADRLKTDIYASPPTDIDPQVMCYKMAFLPPARASLDRLAARAAILEELAASDALAPAAMAKVLASVEADLKTLASPDQLKALPEADRARAAETAVRVQVAVDAINKRLAERN